MIVTIKRMTINDISIPVHNVVLPGSLTMFEDARGLIIFAHGSGSSRLSPRNIQVAELLQSKGFATLLFDLLTTEEDEQYDNRFNVILLAQRLEEVTGWVCEYLKRPTLTVGYFGASTGAAAALIAAAHLPEQISAVVSRGGRPDLAQDFLSVVHTPSLFIVGSNDPDVVMLNQIAMQQMRCQVELTIIPGATHLFEEVGALEQVGDEAAKWFKRFM